MPTTYDVATVANILEVNERTVRKYIATGKLVGFKVKNRWRITMKSVKIFEMKKMNKKKK